MDGRPFATILRRARATDAWVLADRRIASERERHLDRTTDFDDFHAACVACFVAELDRDESFLRAWVAYVGSEIVGTAALTIVPTLPRAGSVRAVDGRIRNVYVLPAFRRRGVATHLVREAIAEAARAGVDRLTLGASADGLPLYRRLGFYDKGDEMMYRARPSDA